MTNIAQNDRVSVLSEALDNLDTLTLIHVLQKRFERNSELGTAAWWLMSAVIELNFVNAKDRKDEALKDIRRARRSIEHIIHHLNAQQ